MGFLIEGVFEQNGLPGILEEKVIPFTKERENPTSNSIVK